MDVIVALSSRMLQVSTISSSRLLTFLSRALSLLLRMMLSGIWLP